MKFNEVTWYSKLFAVILFVAVAVLFFYFGAQYIKIVNGLNNPDASVYFSGSPEGPYQTGYQSAKRECESQINMCNSNLFFLQEDFKDLYSSKFSVLNFKCDAGKKFNTQYGRSSYSPGPGSIYIPHYELVLYFTEDNFEYLSEVNHTSLITQYLSYDKKTFFETNDDKAFIKQNGIVTYKNCTASGN